MSENNTHPCPFFPDMPCPQGKGASDACLVRMNSDFDPIADFKDYQVMDCAILRSRQAAEATQLKHKK